MPCGCGCHIRGTGMQDIVELHRDGQEGIMSWWLRAHGTSHAACPTLGPTCCTVMVRSASCHGTHCSKLDQNSHATVLPRKKSRSTASPCKHITALMPQHHEQTDAAQATPRCYCTGHRLRTLVIDSKLRGVGVAETYNMHRSPAFLSTVQSALSHQFIVIRCSTGRPDTSCLHLSLIRWCN
jgi:hypothetical protein